MFMVCKDECTGYPKGAALKTKEPTSTWAEFEKLYPGSRFERITQFPAVIRADSGTEWKGMFEAKVKERGGYIETGIPDVSETNAIGEREIQEVQYSTVAAMETSGSPADLCFYAARHVIYNRAREPSEGTDARSPYHKLYETPFE